MNTAAEIVDIEGAGVLVETEAGKAEVLESHAAAGLEQTCEQLIDSGDNASIGPGVAGTTAEGRNLGAAIHTGRDPAAQLAVQAPRPGAEYASDE